MDDQERVIRRLVSDRAQILARRLAPAIRPILAATSKGPELIGSGVLLRLGGVGFLVSAAHVLDERRRPLRLAATGGVWPVAGEFVTSVLPSSGLRNDDKIDVGVVRLSSSAAEGIAADDWISADQTDIDEHPCLEPARATNYLVLGFMASRTKVDRATKRANVSMFILTSVAAPTTAYEKLGVDDEGHLVLEFDQRRMNTPFGQQAAPAPHGISGGGIWSLAESLDRDGGQPRLVAISIERHRREIKAILGTRLAMFFEVIRSKYPDLDRDVPRSMTRSISAGAR